MKKVHVKVPEHSNEGLEKKITVLCPRTHIHRDTKSCMSETCMLSVAESMIIKGVIPALSVSRTPAHIFLSTHSCQNIRKLFTDLFQH